MTRMRPGWLFVECVSLNSNIERRVLVRFRACQTCAPPSHAAGSSSRPAQVSVAAPALAGVAAAQRVPDPPGRKLGWAIVGLGSLAINQILPAFARCEKSKVMAFVSGHPDKAEEAGRSATAWPKRPSTTTRTTTAPRQPGHRRRVRRAAQQHARRVHDSRAPRPASTCCARSRWPTRPTTAGR